MKLLSRRDLIKTMLIGGAAVSLTQLENGGPAGAAFYASPLAEIGSGELLLPFSVSPGERESYIGPSNQREYQGYPIAPWLDEDSTISLIFRVPGALPPDTSPSLIVEGMANAMTGRVSIKPKWVAAALTAAIDVPSSGLLPEATRTHSWILGSEARLQRLLMPLGAMSIGVGELVLLDVVFKQSGHTIIQDSFWNFAITWV